jgi:hypothetical protein
VSYDTKFNTHLLDCANIPLHTQGFSAAGRRRDADVVRPVEPEPVRLEEPRYDEPLHGEEVGHAVLLQKRPELVAES